MKRHSLPFRLSVLAAIGLAACASVVPTTAARLLALDPLTADPGGIEVALVLPAGLDVTPGTAVLVLSATRGDEVVEGRFVLEPRTAAGIAPVEAATVAAFGMTADDAARMRDVQARIRMWKAEGPARGSLSMGLGACAVGGGPAPDAKGAALIRLAPDQPFRPLIAEAPLADLVGAAAMAAIGPCKGT